MKVLKFLFLCIVSANYEVISSKHLRDFQEKVSNKIRNGDWELAGGVEAVKVGFAVTFFQAVKKLKTNCSYWF